MVLILEDIQVLTLSPQIMSHDDMEWEVWNLGDSVDDTAMENRARKPHVVVTAEVEHPKPLVGRVPVPQEAVQHGWGVLKPPQSNYPWEKLSINAGQMAIIAPASNKSQAYSVSLKGLQGELAPYS